jgi:hypothetical protein
MAPPFSVEVKKRGDQTTLPIYVHGVVLNSAEEKFYLHLVFTV